MEAIKVLAVDDPAVQGYVKPEYDILGRYGKPVVFDILPWELYYPKMMEALTGQADYDIVMAAGHLWLQELVEKNYLAPLPEIESNSRADIPIFFMIAVFIHSLQMHPHQALR